MKRTAVLLCTGLGIAALCTPVATSVREDRRAKFKVESTHYIYGSELRSIAGTTKSLFENTLGGESILDGVPPSSRAAM